MHYLELPAGRRSASWDAIYAPERLAHVLASDGHRAESWRPVVTLAKGAAAARRLVGDDRTRWMTHEAPRAIVDGTRLPDAPPGRQAD